MKKKAFFIIGIVTMLTILFFNVSLVFSEVSGDISLKLLKNIALADVEGPEVTVTCSAGESGTCFLLDWVWCETGGSQFITYSCTWTGYQTDKCSSIMTVICNKIMP